MANLQELKKYLTHEFSSGSYTGNDYKTFQTKYINYLRAVCRENHYISLHGRRCRLSDFIKV